jgi:alkylation response protein AidB-like acyl-CoA dehydrogenase
MDASLGSFAHRVEAWMEANSRLWRDLNEQEGHSLTAAVKLARELQGSLAEARLGGITWPPDYGGQGLSGAEQRVFDDLALRYHLPLAPFRISLGMSAPTLLEYGSEEQKQRLLPAILRGEALWCQLFSEPAAGSDLASIEAAAFEQDDVWIVRGQKVWTSHAQHADRGLLLVRTAPDRRKREGLTMFALEMHAPGVVVRPIVQMNGDSSFSEVFLEDVAVRDSDRIGDVNAGWTVMLSTLAYERRSIGTRRGTWKKGFTADELVALAAGLGKANTASVRDRLVEHWLDERALEFFGDGVHSRGELGQGPIAKVAAAALARRAASLAFELGGASASAWLPGEAIGERIGASLLSAPAASVAGGTDEMMLNAIGERLLELPREPRSKEDVRVTGQRASPPRELAE